MFSERSAIARESNALSTKLAARRAAGLPILDLTIGNPTTLGIAYDEIALPIAPYDPEPLGLESARRAIARALAREDVIVDPDRIVLAASTSELYAYLFTLLCDPGDEVLVPQPSYPLLAHLASFAGVALAPYPLVYDGRWHADPTELWDAIGERTRAIVTVSPNNPTGSFLGADEAAIIASAGVPIIADEVFATYPLEAPTDRVRAATIEGALVFALDGLSKRAALPQLKLAWATVTGPDALVSEALARIELVADSFLSAATPQQLALPRILETTTAHDAIHARIEANLATLRALTNGTALSVPRVEGGWYAPIRLPATQSDEAWALALLDRGVHVHPGYFYDFVDGVWIVVSLLTSEADLRSGIDILLDALG